MGWRFKLGYSEDLGNLRGFEIYKTSRKITLEGYNSCGTSIARPGSIVISTRAPIGHLAITRSEMSCNQGCRLIEPLIETNIMYYHAFLEASVRELQSWGQGSTFKELPRHRLINHPLLVPSNEELIEFAKFLEKYRRDISRSIDCIEEQILKLKQFRNTIISAAVTGKIDIRGYTNG